MSIPQEAMEVGEELARVYRQAWNRIVDQQIAAMADVLNLRRRQRLTELRTTVEAICDQLGLDTRRWLQERLPDLYRMGATLGALDAGTVFNSWTQLHQEAVQSLATDLFDDLLAATDGVRADTKRFIRGAFKLASEVKATTGQTAVQSARDAARRLVADHGITAVTYRNGARHGLGDYAEMAIRTKTAVAYNTGTLNAASSAGIAFYEILDGPDCGLTFHDDPTLANGLIVERDDAFRWPISHPNCRRSFAGRPDITAPGQIADAERTVTPEQLADQRAFDLRRQLAQQQRRQRRQPRAVRPGRTPRRQPAAPRAPGPHGTPISQALQVRATGPVGADIRAAIDIIDGVHGDGDLAALPVKLSRATQRHGQYKGLRAGGGIDISISDVGTHRRLTTAHEIGHWLDHQAIGRYGYFGSATPDLPEMAEWWEAVKASAAVRSLQTLQGPAGTARYVRYLLTPEELWARSYAQYIATRAADPVMFAELAAERVRGTALYFARQWDDDDFGPIGEAIDRMFATLGWRTP